MHDGLILMLHRINKTLVLSQHRSTMHDRMTPNIVQIIEDEPLHAQLLDHSLRQAAIAPMSRTMESRDWPMSCDSGRRSFCWTSCCRG